MHRAPTSHAVSCFFRTFSCSMRCVFAQLVTFLHDQLPFCTANCHSESSLACSLFPLRARTVSSLAIHKPLRSLACRHGHLAPAVSSRLLFTPLSRRTHAHAPPISLSLRSPLLFSSLRATVFRGHPAVQQTSCLPFFFSSRLSADRDTSPRSRVSSSLWGRDAVSRVSPGGMTCIFCSFFPHLPLSAPCPRFLPPPPHTHTSFSLSASCLFSPSLSFSPSASAHLRRSRCVPSPDSHVHECLFLSASVSFSVVLSFFPPSLAPPLQLLGASSSTHPFAYPLALLLSCRARITPSAVAGWSLFRASSRPAASRCAWPLCNVHVSNADGASVGVAALLWMALAPELCSQSPCGAPARSRV